MFSCPVEKEEARISALHETELLDTPREVEYDQLVDLAAQICEAPISLITLVDRERQWYKAAHGIEIQETSRAISFCAHAIRQSTLFEVEDVAQDRRFTHNPLVTGEPGIRFYAGMPLRGRSGAILGTICVLDTVTRKLSDGQRSGLEVLAAQVEVRVESRLQKRELEESLQSRQKLEIELRASDHRFRTFMKNSPFVSFIKDAEGKFVFYNERLADRFGVGLEDWVGKGDFEVWPTQMATVFRKNDLEVMRSGRLIVTLEETCDSAGHPTIWRTYKFPWRDEQGEMRLGGIAVELTGELARQKALEDANEQLELLATSDTMTGLANRRVLDERVEFEYQFAKRHKTPFSILLLDLDDFKDRNDSFGHAFGDEALKRIGGLIRSTLRATDLAARYGGEEFVVVLPDADAEGAMLFSERLRAAIRAERWPGAPLTASFGIASMDAMTPSGKRLMALADDAMYEAKRTGKDRIVAHGSWTTSKNVDAVSSGTS